MGWIDYDGKNLSHKGIFKNNFKEKFDEIINELIKFFLMIQHIISKMVVLGIDFMILKMT